MEPNRKPENKGTIDTAHIRQGTSWSTELDAKSDVWRLFSVCWVSGIKNPNGSAQVAQLFGESSQCPKAEFGP